MVDRQTYNCTISYDSYVDVYNCASFCVCSQRMYASTHINLVNKIGSQKTVQATEMAEVDYKLLKESVFTN